MASTGEDLTLWVKLTNKLVEAGQLGTLDAGMQEIKEKGRINHKAAYPIVLNADDPYPDLECETCGKEHKYDQIGGWDCILLEDETLIPNSILGAWCNEKCLKESVRFIFR